MTNSPSFANLRKRDGWVTWVLGIYTNHDETEAMGAGKGAGSTSEWVG
jgi:hypothetical protein